ncbi:hypothetical protein F4781DRAFT_383982 [Annulohypoxylon bovei var. microspora]|nr:hypothetical protein F4781DRAFT_383982 [Annulohypoxylon bovei var. microspora]
MENRCRTGQEITDNPFLLNEEYDVAGGWACGRGNECQDWSWRYVAFLGQFGMEIFEDVVTLLNWYKKHGEPIEQDFTVIAEEVKS